MKITLYQKWEVLFDFSVNALYNEIIVNHAFDP